MSVIGFLRLIYGASLALVIILLLVIFIARWAMRRFPERRWIKTVRNWAIAISLVLFGIYLANAASVNLTPRSVIDRSNVNKQTEDFKGHHATPEGR